MEQGTHRSHRCWGAELLVLACGTDRTDSTAPQVTLRTQNTVLEAPGGHRGGVGDGPALNISIDGLN